MRHATSKTSHSVASARTPLAMLDRQRCLVERDLHATCTLCLNACPVGAITLVADSSASVPETAYGSFNPTGPRGPSINESSCLHCGACVTVCPVDALIALPPYDDDALLSAAARIGAQVVANVPTGPSANSDEAAGFDSSPDTNSNTNDAAIGFACERLTFTCQLNTDRMSILPCLGWIDEALLVHAAAAGAQSIMLITTPCTACELAPAVTALAYRAQEAKRILDVANMRTTITIDEQVPAYLFEGIEDGSVEEETDVAGGISRRNALVQMRDVLVDVATETISIHAEALTGSQVNKPALTPEAGKRRRRLLDDLHEIGFASNEQAIVPRSLAPRVDIDTEYCAGCALCAQFCPTQALRRVGKAPGGKTVLEFDASRCLDCSICIVTCRYGALSCEESLTVAELFAFEPREMIIPKRRVLPNRH